MRPGEFLWGVRPPRCCVWKRLDVDCRVPVKPDENDGACEYPSRRHQYAGRWRLPVGHYKNAVPVRGAVYRHRPSCFVYGARYSVDDVAFKALSERAKREGIEL